MHVSVHVCVHGARHEKSILGWCAGERGQAAPALATNIYAPNSVPHPVARYPSPALPLSAPATEHQALLHFTPYRNLTLSCPPVICSQFRFASAPDTPALFQQFTEAVFSETLRKYPPVASTIVLVS